MTVALDNSTRDAVGRPAIPSAPMPTTTIIGATSATSPAASAAAPRTSTASDRGTQISLRPLASARATASATCGGVLDSGAGDMPSVMRPMTKPGPDQQQPDARAVQRVGQSAGERVEARLGRAVDVVGAAGAGAGHRREHHDRTAARRPHRRRQHRQQADLGGVVGVHDRGGMGGVGLGAGLVAEDSERHARRCRSGRTRRRSTSTSGACESSASASNSRTWTAAAPAAVTAATSSVSRSAPRAASTTVAPLANRVASSMPISLRPPKIDYQAVVRRVLHGCDYVLR